MTSSGVLESHYRFVQVSEGLYMSSKEVHNRQAWTEKVCEETSRKRPGHELLLYIFGPEPILE